MNRQPVAQPPREHTFGKTIAELATNVVAAHWQCPRIRSTFARPHSQLRNPMAASKTATLTLRIDPAIKEGLRLLAEQEHRSLANMVEVMIRDYCADKNVSIPEQGNLFTQDQDA